MKLKQNTTTESIPRWLITTTKDYKQTNLCFQINISLSHVSLNLNIYTTRFLEVSLHESFEITNIIK